MAEISIEELGPGVIPIRKGTVVYVHPKGRYIVAECKGVRETFFPEEVLI